MQKIDKKLVKKRFFKSIQTYDENAYVQKIIAEKLIDHLVYFCKKPTFKNVFEMGCGTGLLTKMILEKLKMENFHINDLVPEYEDKILSVLNNYEVNHHFNWSDIEKLDSYPNDLDLIISSATIQWLNDFETFFKQLKTKILSHTYLAFTTFGPQNLLEINRLENTSLEYININEIHKILKKHYEIIWIHEEMIQMHFNNPIDVLKHLKLTGVTGVKKNMWTREHFNHFENEYNDLFKTDKGLSLTYHPIYFIMKVG